MSKIKFQTPKGMQDIIGDDFLYFDHIFEVFKKIVKAYNFTRIETPILEEVQLFLRSVGKMTDICEKEMYCLRTKSGDVLALRPEGTAPICRAYLEHGLKEWPQPVRLWYFGPFFRHEKPQAGRYRQFWQGGVEIINGDDPVLDIEVLQIFLTFLNELGIKNFELEINTIGCADCQSAYKKVLNHYLKKREKELCENCKRRRKSNILRVLDCKEEKCQEVIKKAPQIIDYLCDQCKAHFSSLLETLDALNFPYVLNPFLVRGLDYYNQTVFEIFAERKTEENQEDVSKRRVALISGGRYNNLIKLLGGERTPSVGGAFGLERIIELIKAEKLLPEKEEKIRVFIAQIGNVSKIKALKLASMLYEKNIRFFSGLGKDSLKAQLKLADKLKVNYCLILAQKEVLENRVLLRNMKDGSQDIVPIEKVAELIKK